MGADDQPVSNEVVYLFVEDSQKLTLTTDLKGIVLFSLDTTLWTDSVSLRVSWSVLFAEQFQGNVFMIGHCSHVGHMVSTNQLRLCFVLDCSTVDGWKWSMPVLIVVG